MNHEKKRVDACRVKPVVPKRLSLVDLQGYEKTPDSAGCIGTIVWLLTCSVSFGFLFELQSEGEAIPCLIWLAPFVTASLATAWVINWLRKKHAAKRLVEKNKELVTASDQAAASATRDAASNYDRSFNILAEIERIAALASRSIEQAEAEFRLNAFSPFWDNIERAISHLVDCGEEIRKLSWTADGYHKALQGREHDFPQFPITNEMMPDFRLITNQLYKAIRLGQTNFEFASIYEQRKTREVLIRGFKNLGDAIDRFGSSITTSLGEFRIALQGGLDKTRR